MNKNHILRENNPISLILNRIKLAYGFKKDIELSSFLGVSPNTITTWRDRNSINYDLVFSKCENLNYDWLITGRGEMLRNSINQNIYNSPHAHVNGSQNSVQVIENQRKDTKNNSYNNNKGVIISDNTNANIDNRQYYSDSPDVLRAQIDERDRLIGEKEKIIFEKDERIREKDERIREKDERIRELAAEKDELKQRVKTLESR